MSTVGGYNVREGEPHMLQVREGRTFLEPEEENRTFSSQERKTTLFQVTEGEHQTNTSGTSIFFKVGKENRTFFRPGKESRTFSSQEWRTAPFSSQGRRTSNKSCGTCTFICSLGSSVPVRGIEMELIWNHISLRIYRYFIVEKYARAPRCVQMYTAGCSG